MTVYLKDRLYLPAKSVDPKLLQEHYQKRLYDERECRACPLKGRRHSSSCEDCSAYKGWLRAWSKETIKGKDYVAVPSGSLSLVRENLELDLPWEGIKDLRKEIPFRSELKFTGKLRTGGKDADGNSLPDQVKIVEKWLSRTKKNRTGGFIKARPRSGKTVLGVFTATTLRLRTFITASQVDWLRQFCMRFAEQTNILDIVAKKGIKNSPIVLIDRTGWPEAKLYGVRVLTKWDESVHNADVVISTYQQFITKKGKDRLKLYLNNKFSLGIVDEADMASATCFSAFLNRIPFRYKLGLTATIEREDKSEKIIEAIFGRVLAEGKTSSLVPKLTLWETGLKVKEYKQWHRLEQAYMDHTERNKMIVRQVFKDLRENPTNCVLIPVNRVEHIHNLVKMINHQAQVCRMKGEKWPQEVAIPFTGASNRAQVLNQAIKRDIRVVVAVSRMVKRGLDVPAWTHVYTGIVPTSNAPNFYQQACRVATPFPKKSNFIVRMLIDPNKASLGCFRNLVYSHTEFGIAKGLKRKQPFYLMDKRMLKRMREIVGYPKSYSYTDAPDFTRLGRINKQEKQNNKKIKSGFSAINRG